MKISGKLIICVLGALFTCAGTILEVVGELMPAPEVKEIEERDE